MTTPKYTGSRPKFLAMGSRIGVRIIMAGPESMTQPTRISITFTMIMKVTGLLVMEVIALARSWGMAQVVTM